MPRPAALVLLALVGALAGCSANQSSGSTGGGSAVVTPSPSGGETAAINVIVTERVRAQLLAAGAVLNGLPVSDYTGLRPGQTYDAFDPTTNTFWAGAGLVPSPSSVQAQVSVQDDGAYVLFERPDTGSWMAHDVGLAGVDGATCPVRVPASILQLWGWRPGSCRPPSNP